MAVSCSIELLLAHAPLSDVLAYAAFIAEGTPVDAVVATQTDDVDTVRPIEPTRPCVYAPTWYDMVAAE